MKNIEYAASPAAAFAAGVDWIVSVVLVPIRLKMVLFRNRKRKYGLAVIGAVVFLSAYQAYAAKNYPDPNRPYYSGKYAVGTSEPVEALSVVSYNIWFAEDIDQALSELKEIDSQRKVDILLLQEMDEEGTDRIAQGLQLNYVYYPAAVEPTYGKDFGNAILSRWPIVDSRKLILPHKSLSNRMNRIATRGTIQVQGADILVYSVHMESVFTLPRFREDQYAAILDDVDPEARHVIVGGDFNSFTTTDVEEIEQIHRQAGFSRASQGSGSTVLKYGIEVAPDHIFAKGFGVLEAGTMTGATASDHLPVWVTLMLK